MLHTYIFILLFVVSYSTLQKDILALGIETSLVRSLRECRL